MLRLKLYEYTTLYTHCIHIDLLMSIFMIVMCMFQVSGGAGEDNY